jgi:hypothetical protein
MTHVGIFFLFLWILQFIYALTESGLYVEPEHEFASGKRRFEERFPAFRTVGQPQSVAFEQFCNDTKKSIVPVSYCPFVSNTIFFAAQFLDQ